MVVEKNPLKGDNSSQRRVSVVAVATAVIVRIIWLRLQVFEIMGKFLQIGESEKVRKVSSTSKEAIATPPMKRENCDMNNNQRRKFLPSCSVAFFGGFPKAKSIK